MKIRDINCSVCGAAYQVAESASMAGEPGRQECVMCGHTLDRWDTPKLKAFRMELAPYHKYAHVPVHQ